MEVMVEDGLCPSGRPEEAGLRVALAALLAGAATPAAAALYTTLHQSIRRRVSYCARHRYGDLLTRADQEDLVSEIACRLVFGALHIFRGTTDKELRAFVRTVTDRQIWRLVQQKLRERRMLKEHGPQAARDWSGAVPAPESALIAIPASPLSPTDTAYLLGLVAAGSQAAYARELQVSRAAVTQRLHRIRRRIAALTETERDTAQSWMRQNLARRRAGRASAIGG